MGSVDEERFGVSLSTEGQLEEAAACWADSAEREGLAVMPAMARALELGKKPKTGCAQNSGTGGD